MPEIVALSKEHDRTGFDCGVVELNAFLKSTARQHGDKGISRTFVLTDHDSPVIMGFFTLTLCEVVAEKLPAGYARKYPQHGLPAVRLARLAVSIKYQGKQYGELLLAEAVHRTALIPSRPVPSVCLWMQRTIPLVPFTNAMDSPRCQTSRFSYFYHLLPSERSPPVDTLFRTTFQKALSESVNRFPARSSRSGIRGWRRRRPYGAPRWWCSSYHLHSSRCLPP